ncbi:MAG: hypothetical protein JSU98_14395 [Gemmatimonadales bacterium]|nr:MAG: hypothetical protein JSU98_14395 [Gemmatimonadales bacterium]
MEFATTVPPEEVQRACAELGLRDWTQALSPPVTLEEAEILRARVGAEALEVSIEAFKRGLEVELEHGSEFSDANVTNGHPVLTGKIVLAHLKESLLYYERLDVAELEGDLLKAIQSGDGARTVSVHRKLLTARIHLAEQELAHLDT